MRNPRILLALSLDTSLLALATSAYAQEQLKVVASFSILGDMAREIGGEHIDWTTLVGPNGDAHVFEPSAAHARTVSEADVLIVNGLGFEGWLPRLVEAAEFKGTQVEAAIGVSPRANAEADYGDEHEYEEGAAAAGHDQDHEHEHAAEGDDHAGEEHKHEEEAADHDHEEHEHAGEEDHEHEHEGHHHHGPNDPHAWQDLANGVIYANNIAAAFAAADPDHAQDYQANAEAYVAELQALDDRIKNEIAAIPEDSRRVVTSHDAFGYFAEAYGIEFIAPEGVSTDSEATAADVAAIIAQIRHEGIDAVFVENVTDTRLVDQIATEAGVKVGGSLFSDALSDETGPAPSYLAMFEHNVDAIVSALKPE